MALQLCMNCRKNEALADGNGLCDECIAAGVEPLDPNAPPTSEQFDNTLEFSDSLQVAVDANASAGEIEGGDDGRTPLPDESFGDDIDLGDLSDVEADDELDDLSTPTITAPKRDTVNVDIPLATPEDTADGGLDEAPTIVPDAGTLKPQSTGFDIPDTDVVDGSGSTDETDEPAGTVDFSVDASANLEGGTAWVSVEPPLGPTQMPSIRTTQISSSSQFIEEYGGFNRIPLRTVREEGEKHAEFADYMILDKEPIGKGGVGLVREATQGGVRRDVAVKTILKSKDVRGDKASENLRSTFVAEATLSAKLDHPNIVPIHELGRAEDGTIFYSMKHVKGQGWHKVIESKSESDNVEILMKVADAMAYAHSRGILHCDLKPENVMIGEYGEVLLMDWGGAVELVRLRKHGICVVQGTPEYAAPEMFNLDYERIGPVSDVYLLGSNLFEVLTGKPPRVMGNRKSNRITECQENLIVDAKSRSKGLMQIAMKAMSTDPKDRYQSVEEFQAAVKKEYADKQRLNRTLLAGAGVLLVGVVIASSAAFLSNAARKKAVASEFKATKAEAKAVASLAKEKDALQKKEAALALAEEANAEAIRKRDEALRAQEKEAKARVAEEQARKAEEREKMRALAAEIEAKEERDRANTEKDRAEIAEGKAKENEQAAIRNLVLAERRKFTAGISLADKLISDQDPVLAAQTLGDIFEEDRRRLEGDENQDNLMGWEWFRLNHLTHQDTPTRDAGGNVVSTGTAVAGSVFFTAANSFTDGPAMIHLWQKDVDVPIQSIPVEGTINAAAISPDGRFIAVATNIATGSLRIIDATNGNVASIAPVVGEVSAVAFSPLGESLLVGSVPGANRQTANSQVYLFPIAEGRLAVAMELGGGVGSKRMDNHRNRVASVGWSTDGKYIYSAGDRGTSGRRSYVFVREALRPNDEGRTRVICVRDSHVLGAAMSADTGDGTRMIACATLEEKILVFEHGRDQLSRLPEPTKLVPPTSPVATLYGHDLAVRSVAFHGQPNQNPTEKIRLLSAGDDRAPIVWDVSNGEREFTLRGHAEPVRACVFAGPNTIVSAGYDGEARIWDLTSYRDELTLESAGEEFIDARISPDSKTAVVAGRRSAIVWNLADESRRELRVGHAGRVEHASWLHATNELLTAADDGSICLWNSTDARQLRRWRSGDAGILVNASTSGKYFVTAKETRAPSAGDTQSRPTIQVWNSAKRQVVNRFVPNVVGPLNSIAVSDDGRMVAMGVGKRASAHTVQVWDASQPGRTRRMWMGDSLKTVHRTEALAFTADGAFLYSAHNQGSSQSFLFKWRASTGGDPVVETKLQNDAVAQLSTHGGRVVVITQGRKIYDWNNGTLMATEDEHPIASAAVKDADGVLYVDALSGVSFKRSIATSMGKMGRRNFVSQSPMLASGIGAEPNRVWTVSRDGYYRIWNSQTAEVISQARIGAEPLEMIASSADESRFAFVTSAGTIGVWGTATGIEATTQGPAEIHSLAWQGDRVLIAMGTGNVSQLAIWTPGEVMVPFAANIRSRIQCLYSTSDGGVFAAGTTSGQVAIWSRDEASDTYKQFDAQGQGVGVTSVALARYRSARRLLVGDENGRIRMLVIDPEQQTKAELISLVGHNTPVASMHFSKNGRELVTTSQEGKAIQWLTKWATDGENPAVSEVVTKLISNIAD